MMKTALSTSKPLECRRFSSKLKPQRKKYVFHGIGIASCTFIIALYLSSNFNSNHLQIRRKYEDIQEEETNFTTSDSTVDSFPSGFFTKDQRQNGAVAINFLVAFYIFGAIAIICDDYFVPSLEGITEGLNLAPDVAGATFMAAGSSAPEFFTSIIGVFITGGDIGTGTILGSAVFNLLFIIGLCGLLAGMVIQLLFWPMFRDSVYYLISIVALIAAISDFTVHWYEGAIFMLLYAGYIFIMYFNENLEEFINGLFNQNKDISERTLLTENLNENDGFTLQNGNKLQTNGECSKILTVEIPTLNRSHGHNQSIASTTTTTVNKLEEKREESVLSVPDGCLNRCIWVIALPIYVLFYLTIPDCRRAHWKNWYMLTFLMSVIYIGGLSYVLVWMVSIIGDTFGIDDSVMGLTLLAAGTSVPDAMASVIAARDGFGGMAISNSLGSNIFDILLCLGTPWFIKTLFVDFNGIIKVYSTNLVFTAAMLLATVFLMVLIFYLRRGKLNRCTGLIFLVFYFIFITLCILSDYLW
ncbi:sodium/potassium/calcium exchanger 5-like isoform X3 [Antedon mediterranea]|uniref:sodium/potassium/calcium exchanger 5-like isoform X3 n=1 Tax=Antedon mediterranea TaxID=105859 RepID=UPI003AF77AA5